MFCPNCATDNNVELRYCRNCGLKLERIVAAVVEQMPSDVDADYLRRKGKFERAGLGYLLVAGLIGLALTVFFVIQYTNFGYYFGPILFGAIIAWIFLFVLPAVALYFYPRLFMEPKYLPRTEVPASPAATSRLIDDRPFEPVPPSVTEDTTDLLNVPRSKTESKI